MVYGSHIIADFIWIQPYFSEVIPNSRLVLSIVFIGIIIAAIIHDSIKNKINIFNYYNSNKYNFIKKITFIITLILLIIFTINAIVQGSVKKSSWGNLGILILFLQYFGVTSFIYSWTSQSKTFWKVISTIPIIIFFIGEARAFAIIGIISLIMIKYYNNKIFSLKTVKLTFALILILLAAYLPRYGNKIIEANNKGTLIPYISVMVGSYEFGQIGYNLNASVDPNYDSNHTLSSLLFGSIPIINRLIENREMRRFHEHIEKYLNPGFNYGLGGTFWGESFVLGGIIGVIINLLLIIIFIEWLKTNILRGNIYYPLYMLTLVFFAFYLPRNDIFIMIAVIKNLLIFILLFHLSINFFRKKSFIK